MEFIRTYLCCCLASSHTRDDPERQPILQPDYEIPNEQSGVGEEGGEYGAVDQQKLERRLTGIVRSKESKMVKIGYTHPFNLHNKDPVGSETTISRSNSNSGSSFVHHSHHHNHSQHHNHNHSHHNPAQGTQNTYASSSEHVPQPQYAHHQQHQQQPQYAYGAHPYAPSPLSHSRSASRDPEDDSRPNVPYADEAEVYYDDDGEEGRAQPILNVRLVQRTKEGGGGGGEGDGRGRKRERVGGGGGGTGGAGKQKAPAPAPPVGDEEELQTPTEATAGRGGVWEAGEVPVSKKQKKTFVLDDVDSIAVSWGD